MARTKSIGLAWIVVKDFKKAVKYYTEVAGLKVTEMCEEWGWAELEGHDGSGMKLGIAQARSKGQDPIQPGQNAVITLTVENIDTATKDLQKNGADLVGPIEEVPGCVKMQTVRDTEGNIFQVVQILSKESCSTPKEKMKSSCCAH